MRNMSCSLHRLNVVSPLLATSVLLSLACGPGWEPPSTVDTATHEDELVADNGLTANGLVTNGLVTNGLVTNGLVTNGLVTNGLQAVVFTNWFNANPTDYSDSVMHYVVTCALPSSSSLTWTNPLTGVRYTWPGLLGLTPNWAAGKPATETEQQLISACLAAHVNKFGMHVQLSINGRDANGHQIAFDQKKEPKQFEVTEACFFGNLFTGEGVFAANDRTTLSTAESTTRACGLSSQASGVSTECAPLVHVGMCKDFCQFDPAKMFYKSCTYNGKHYMPLTTRIKKADVYTCGDGVCQFTESCGTSSTTKKYNDCGVDCGVCP